MFYSFGHYCGCVAQIMKQISRRHADFNDRNCAWREKWVDEERGTQHEMMEIKITVPRASRTLVRCQPPASQPGLLLAHWPTAGIDDNNDNGEEERSISDFLQALFASLPYLDLQKDNNEIIHFPIRFLRHLTMEGRSSRCLRTPSILATFPKARRR